MSLLLMMVERKKRIEHNETIYQLNGRQRERNDFNAQSACKLIALTETQIMTFLIIRKRDF